MKGSVRFVNKSQADFFKVLRTRVDQYFKENNLSKSGGNGIVVKTIAAFALYLVPFALILTGLFPLWAMILLVICMGIGTGAVGFGVMHDANHGSLSKHPKINRILSYTLNFVGGHAFLWRIQHNVLHHTYTNIHELDEDLEAGHLIRLSKVAPLKKFHKYQYLYGLPLYGLMTLAWVTVADFTRLARYEKMGLVKRNGSTYKKELGAIIISKIIYLSYTILLPFLILGLPFWYIIVGFLLLHFTAGIILSVVFQCAHIVEETEQPLANDVGTIENEWAIHQLQTTANFATNNKLLTWYTGGLNYQVEHHLFSRINHVHYPAISKIVKATAEEYGIPYHEQPTFGKAFLSHIKMLKQLGRVEVKPAVATN